MPDAKRLPTLDGLRGLAALAVVFAHTVGMIPAAYGPTTHEKAAPGWAWFSMLLASPLHMLIGGHEAVLLFFVLSGFVLGRPWMAGRGPGYAAFIVRRFCRIYLPYAAVMAASLGLALAFALPTPLFGGSWLETLWIKPPGVVDFLEALAVTDSARVNPSIWTLGHEMRLAYVFPVLVVLVRRVPWWVAVAIAMSLLWLPQTNDAVGSGHFAALFLIGALLARYAAAVTSWLGRRTAWQLGALLAGAIVLYNGEWLLTQQEVAVDALVGAGAALLLLLALVDGPLARVLGTPVCRWLGRVSYSLYLIHVPVLLVLVSALGRMIPLGVALVLAPPVALCLAAVLQVKLEQQCIDLGRWLTRPRTGPRLGVAVRHRLAALWVSNALVLR